MSHVNIIYASHVAKGFSLSPSDVPCFSTLLCLPIYSATTASSAPSTYSLPQTPPPPTSPSALHLLWAQWRRLDVGRTIINSSRRTLHTKGHKTREICSSDITVRGTVKLDILYIGMRNNSTVCFVVQGASSKEKSTLWCCGVVL